MRHFYTLIAAFAASLLLSANAQSKLDLQSRIQLEEYRNGASVVNQSETTISDIGRLVPKSALPSFAPGVAPMKLAFVGINDGYTVADLEAAGYEVLSNTGKIAIVNVSMDDVENMADLDAVKTVQLGRKLHKCTDKARDNAGVTAVHNGFDYNGTNLQYDGSGVITAIYDAGVAPNHLNFFDEDGNSRVKRVLCYLEDEDDSSSINIYDFNTPEKVASFQTDDEQETHGTHTLGILAGGYKGAAKYCTVTPNADYTAFIDSTTVEGNNPFYGVSTGSDILVGCGTFDDAAIAHAATQMAQQAAEEGKPIVFSCSIGSNIGAHDGSDYLSQTLSTLANDYNLIPVVAAGNEGADKMSVRKSFTSATDKLVTCVTPLSGYSQCYSLVDFWSDSSEPFTLKVTCYTKSLFSGGTSTDICTVDAAGQSFQYTNSNNSTLKSAFSAATVIALSEVDQNNGRFHTLMLFNYTRKSLSSNFLYVTVTYQSGRTVTGVINNYGEFTSQSAISGSVAGTGEFSISTMACHPDVISVGSYNSRGMWNRLGGGVQGQKNFQENAVTSFSSYGTDDNGNQLPTLLGPGTNIMSSYSPY
ncbi:MAG: S8 family serine peptidase, partial [Paramuribaculum sp.]|nr:S8 family serine peptidase [Paramuribaculum sp.]